MRPPSGGCRSHCALVELDGLETNRVLLAAVLDDATFGRGEVDVHYLEHRQDLRDARLPDAVRRRHAAAVGFCLLDERAASSLVPVPVAGWRNVGHPLHADQLTDDSGTTMEVRVATPGEPARVLVDAVWHEVGTASTGAAGWWTSRERTGCAGATGSGTRRTGPR